MAIPLPWVVTNRPLWQEKPHWRVTAPPRRNQRRKGKKMPGSVSVDRPMRFTGTEAEREANRATHEIVGEDGRCTYCDSRDWSDLIDWPCGEGMREVLLDGVRVRTYSEAEE